MRALQISLKWTPGLTVTRPSIWVLFDTPEGAPKVSCPVLRGAEKLKIITRLLSSKEKPSSELPEAGVARRMLEVTMHTSTAIRASLRFNVTAVNYLQPLYINICK